jgi:hypothetical protein
MSSSRKSDTPDYVFLIAIAIIVWFMAWSAKRAPAGFPGQQTIFEGKKENRLNAE